MYFMTHTGYCVFFFFVFLTATGSATYCPSTHGLSLLFKSTFGSCSSDRSVQRLIPMRVYPTSVVPSIRSLHECDLFAFECAPLSVRLRPAFGCEDFASVSRTYRFCSRRHTRIPWVCILTALRLLDTVLLILH